jgi:hypothetical protein
MYFVVPQCQPLFPTITHSHPFDGLATLARRQKSMCAGTPFGTHRRRNRNGASRDPESGDKNPERDVRNPESPYIGPSPALAMVFNAAVGQLSDKRQHEREVVSDTARTVCGRLGLTVVEIQFPEDDLPPRDGEIDGLVLTTGPSVAIEHTLHQSFENQVTQGYWFQRVSERAERISGTLPGPGRYILNVRAEVLEGQRNADLDLLEKWIRDTAPELSEHRGYGSTPMNVAAAVPPDVPFPLQLMRSPHSEGVADGDLRVGWPFDMDVLPTRNIDEMSRLLRRKLPKLEEHRPDGGLTMLLLENQDIQLVNPDNVSTALRSALDANQDLTIPDIIVMINVIGDERGISWFKDRDGWHQMSDWYWVAITPTDPA